MKWKNWDAGASVLHLSSALSSVTTAPQTFSVLKSGQEVLKDIHPPSKGQLMFPRGLRGPTPAIPNHSVGLTLPLSTKALNE